MYSLNSKNQELNTYINSFIEFHFQPLKMYCWRILILCLFGLLSLGKDYQYYRFSLENWFTWTPMLVIIVGILTINFQSLYLGSMCYQYRHHDAAFQISRRFHDVEYSSLINELNRKLKDRKYIYRRSCAFLCLLLLGLLILLGIKTIFWQSIITGATQYFALTIYIFLIFTLVLAAVSKSIYIVASNREAELIELSLFWIKSASTLKYIESV